ncbi:MAG: MFS transporter [Candidatus Omnitrophica bacterium]|nr:MFS transporter [Candidatus Omnitrophota bacterium]
MIGSYIKILKNRNFFLFWLGQVISQFGDRLTQIALIGLVYKRLGTSSLALAKIMFFTILPVFLINPLAGVYVDRWDKRRTMYVSDFIRGILILILATFVINFSNFLPLYIIIFLAFCVGRFFIPAKMSLIPLLVCDKEIFMANSLVSVTANVAAILGFGIGGVIVEAWGPKGGFILDSFTFFLSSILILSITLKTQGLFKSSDLLELGKEVVEVEKSLFREFKEGIKYLLSKQSTMFSIKTLSILFSCLGALYVVFIVFIQQTLNTATKDLGFLAVGLGIGLFTGSLVYGRFAHKFSLTRTVDFMLFLSSLFLVIFVTVIKYIPNTFLGWVFSFVLGGLAAPIVVGCNSLIHKKSENNFWGRIFSNLEVVMHFSFIVFMFVTSILAEIFSPFSIIISVGIIITLFSLFSLLRKDSLKSL